MKTLISALAAFVLSVLAVATPAMAAPNVTPTPTLSLPMSLQCTGDELCNTIEETDNAWSLFEERDMANDSIDHKAYSYSYLGYWDGEPNIGDGEFTVTNFETGRAYVFEVHVNPLFLAVQA